MGWYLLAALFLPLFPLSMLFNQVLARLGQPWLRAGVLLAWPQLGLLLLAQAPGQVPDWLAIWALLSALFYAYRAIAVNELGLWIGFIATSAWALLWLGGAGSADLHLHALAFSLPLAVLNLIAGDIQHRFGAAHLRLDLCLAARVPRLAAVLVVAILAAVATPLFPNFFSVLTVVLGRVSSSPMLALGLVVVWLLWSWAGARLLQGMVVGRAQGDEAVEDISGSQAWAYAVGFLVLVIAGLQLVGAPS